MYSPPLGQRAPSSSRSAGAFTRAELLAVAAALSFLAAVIAPALGNDTFRSQRAICSNNLSRIGQALTSWAADHDELYPWMVSPGAGGTRGNSQSFRASSHFSALSNEVKTPALFACPSDAKSRANNFSSFFDNNVSYFLAHPDLAEGRAILSGDRNITPVQTTDYCPDFQVNSSLVRPATNATWSPFIHVRQGYLLFNDGSVEGADTTRLRALLSPVGITNSFHFFPPSSF